MWTKSHSIHTSFLCHPCWQEIETSWNVNKLYWESSSLPPTPQNPFQDSLGIYYRNIVHIWVIYLIDMWYKYQTWTFIHPLKVKVLCDTRWKRICLFFKQPQKIIIFCVDFCCARMFTYPTKHKYWIITMWWNICCI